MSDPPKERMIVQVTMKNNPVPLVFTNVSKFDWETEGNRVTKLSWTFVDPKKVLGHIDLDQIAAITYEPMPSYDPPDYITLP